MIFACVFPHARFCFALVLLQINSCSFFFSCVCGNFTQLLVWHLAVDAPLPTETLCWGICQNVSSSITYNLQAQEWGDSCRLQLTFSHKPWSEIHLQFLDSFESLMSHVRVYIWPDQIMNTEKTNFFLSIYLFIFWWEHDLQISNGSETKTNILKESRDGFLCQR